MTRQEQPREGTTSPSSPWLSVVTTCKGRLGDLRGSLPSWLAMEGASYEIIVVYYDCPDGTADTVERHRADWLASSRATDLRTVRATNRPCFNLNDARNLGLAAARGTATLFIDADVAVQRPTLPALVAETFSQGALFLGNVPFLSSLYEEARLFFQYQYGVAVEALLLLPLLADEVGLTGTCCVLTDRARQCGSFDAAVNETGYGSDDIEFYLRYANSRLVTGTPPADPILDCDALMGQLRVFLQDTFHATDNTEQEKARFYPMAIRESQAHNKVFLARTARKLSEAAWPLPGEPQARRRLVLGQPWPPRLPQGVPEWFPSWFYYWYSVALWDRGILEAQLGDFPQDLWREGSVGDMEASNRSRYRMATLAYRIGRNADARRLLECLLSRPQEPSLLLRAGAQYYLGELSRRENDPSSAARHFAACLADNPDHRAARKGLESTTPILFGGAAT